MAAPSDVNEIYLSSSPHFSAGNSTTGIMLCVIIAMLPLCVCGVMLFGLPALATIAVSTISCVVFEALFQKFTKQPLRIKDCSAVVTGMLLALVLPPQTPIWMTILGALFAVVVAKGFFGGIGANVFNPALAGRAFMFVSFPVAMTSWTLPANASGIVDATSSATVLSVMKSGFSETSDLYGAFFLGNRAGCIGETSIMLILLAFVFLAAVRIIDWRAPLAMTATTALLTLISGGDALFSVLSGGLLFGAVFMATDYATAPVTKGGRLLFGFGCGLITFLIRKFSGYPEGVMFSILIMNAVVPFLNKITGRKYGYAAAKSGTGAAK